MTVPIFERVALRDFPDELTLEEVARWMTASGDDRSGEARYRDAHGFLLELVKRGQLSPVRSESREVSIPQLVRVFNASNLFEGSGSTSTPVARNNAIQKRQTTAHYFTPPQLCQIKGAAEQAGYWGCCVQALISDAGLGEHQGGTSPLEDENTPPGDTASRYSNLKTEDFVKRKELIELAQMFDRPTRETEGELAATASCVRLVKEGHLTMPNGFPANGRGYWVLPEAMAWKKRSYPDNKVAPIKKRNPRH